MYTFVRPFFPKRLLTGALWVLSTMAAPCWRYAWRSLWQISSGPVRLKAAVRFVSSSAQKVKSASPPSPWTLHGAVCLQRLPVISQDLSPIEEKFMKLMRQVLFQTLLKSSDVKRMVFDLRYICCNRQ